MAGVTYDKQLFPPPPLTSAASPAAVSEMDTSAMPSLNEMAAAVRPMDEQPRMFLMLDRLLEGEKFVVEALRGTKLMDIGLLHDAFHHEQLQDETLQLGGNQVLRAAMFIMPEVKAYFLEEEHMSCDASIGRRVEAMLWYCHLSPDSDVK